jgi:hypothetical protein
MSENPQKRIPGPADDVAKCLANLLQTPVIGYMPETMIDEGPPLKLIIKWLLTGELRLNQYLRKDRHSNSITNYFDADSILISSLINGNQDLRQRIFDIIKENMIPRRFDRIIFHELKTLHENGIVNKANINNIRNRLPELWFSSEGIPFSGRVMVSVYFRWIQMIECRFVEKDIEQAIDYYMSIEKEKPNWN